MSTSFNEPIIPNCFNGVLPLVVNVAKRTPYDTYIGRNSRGHTDLGWGNPCKMRSNSLKARIEAVTCFWELFQSDPVMQSRLNEVVGSTLGCWCAPLLCHGHVLAIAAQYGSDCEGLREWMVGLNVKGSNMPFRLLVTGSRDWLDEKTVSMALLQQWHEWGKPSNAVLVVGDADGADEIAARLWQRAGFEIEVHAADWDNLGKRAGMVRNAAMISSGVDVAIAFQSGNTPGTRQCSESAKKAGVPTRLFAPAH